MHGDISDVIGRLDGLPSLPRLVGELAAAGDLAEVDLGWLSGRISLDQGLSIRLLRLANSSFYGLPSRVASVEQAVQVLGVRNVHSVVMTCAVLDGFAVVPAVPGFDYRQFWRHSMATAVCGRHLARALGCDPAAGFTVGMLHDIGQLALCVTCPERYAAVLAQVAEGAGRDATELSQLGFSHAEVGLRLSHHWQLPPEFCDAVGSHHAGAEQALLGRLAVLVAHADALAHALGYGSDMPGAVEAGPAAAGRLASLGYDADSAAAWCAKAAADIDSLLQALVE